MPTPALRARSLGKRYPAGNIALQDVTLDVPTGQVFGLIGRNGAGKTTFVRIAGTQLTPTSGTLEVLGLDVMKQTSDLRTRIAAVPQESRPLYFVHVDELVYLYLRMRGMERAEAHRRTEAALQEFTLTPVRRRMVNQLSGGMRRRAMVAMVLASDAELMFLDEPTTGLDPMARREVWAAIRRIEGEGRTIVLTTHYLDEAEALSSQLAVIDGGRVLLQGSPSELRARIRRPYRVTVQGALLRSDLEGFGEVSEISGGFLVFATEADARELAMTAMRAGAHVSMGPASLEDIFLQVVGRRIDEDEPALTEVT
jgi:ABC-2 type transport system ATP-binding protein